MKRIMVSLPERFQRMGTSLLSAPLTTTLTCRGGSGSYELGTG
jgi:hypothetical protein